MDSLRNLIAICSQNRLHSLSEHGVIPISITLRNLTTVGIRTEGTASRKYLTLLWDIGMSLKLSTELENEGFYLIPKDSYSSALRESG